jgi:amino acid transporter
MTEITAGARGDAGAHAIADSGRDRGDPDDRELRPPLHRWAFLGFAVASFGGPLALAASGAPSVVGDAAESSGLAMLAGAVAFLVPLGIWLRYSREITGSGGLFAFVEAAAGRRVALAQAAIWIFSYLLYVIYTTVQIVYDLLPSVIPGAARYETVLALGIPVVLVAVMLAGRAAAFLVLGVIAAGQLALAGILDGVTLAHISTPLSSFGTGAPAGSLAKASAQTSQLYVCGSLPLFLGGELATPSRTIRRGTIAAFVLTALVIVLAVAPLAAAPGLLRTDLPGLSVAEQFVGTGLARAIGIGVAVSTAGVILCEYVALTRLIHAIGRWRIQPIAAGIGVVALVAAPISLIDPDGFYNSLLKPSEVALWLSQLVVFAVYPLFAIKRRMRMWPAFALALGASAFAVYGILTALQQSSS